MHLLGYVCLIGSESLALPTVSARARDQQVLNLAILKNSSVIVHD